jgi:hypothetical protein
MVARKFSLFIGTSEAHVDPIVSENRHENFACSKAVLFTAIERAEPHAKKAFPVLIWQVNLSLQGLISE